MKDQSEQITDKDGKSLVKLARRVVSDHVRLGHVDTEDKELMTKFNFNSGIFVTLNDPTGLRGCIGFPLPDKKLYNALIEAAVASATKDPRFPSVSSDELDKITFEITILTVPQKIFVSNSDEYLSKIKVGRDGLIVRYKQNSGLLLPQVPLEYGWSKQEFLEYTCEKAGIARDSWKNKQEIEILKFEGIIFEEREPNGEVVRKKIIDV